MSEKFYGATCIVCGRHSCTCKKPPRIPHPPRPRVSTPQPDPPPEYVIFRGKRWFVADAEWNPSPLEDGVGSHWHLTLTNPLEGP